MPVHHRLRFLTFPMRTSRLCSLWPDMRPLRFRRVPFGRDVAFDPGGATASRIAMPHMLPSTVPSVSASAKFFLSWLNPTPHPITVYASHPPSPTTAQHSLPGGALPPYRGRSFTGRIASASPDAPEPEVRIHLPPAQSHVRTGLVKGVEVLFVGVIRLVPVTTLKIEAAGPATALIPFFFPLRPTLFLTVADIGLQCSDSPQVGNPRTVLCRANGIRIAHAEAYIFRRIIADVVHHRSERRVARFERHEHSRVPFDRSRRIVAVQRAPLVQHMHECPKDCKDGNLRPFEPQLLRAAERHTLHGGVEKEDVQLRCHIREHTYPPVADPHHQGRFAVMHRHHRIGGEDQLSPWPRKADEGEAGQDGRERDPAYDLGRRDYTAVQCRRIHLAVADRRQRLDTEEEGVREAMRPNIRHRSGNCPIEHGEDEIH